ncbi:MAG: rhodanese-related sulfurtransferase [Synechococcaceae cyanobacterium SM2_3_1]|nr:rhodanese-related sulfurtransferase [Synechococcaceae cyanobacterium SM2_3_1]
MGSASQVSVRELQQILATQPPESVQLIDVREPGEIELANLAHLGFVNYPLSHYEQWSRRLLTDLDLAKPTYVLCHHGLRSAQMAAWLRSQGFTQVINVSGGIDAWSRAVDPEIPLY